MSHIKIYRRCHYVNNVIKYFREKTNRYVTQSMIKIDILYRLGIPKHIIRVIPLNASCEM